MTYSKSLKAAETDSLNLPVDENGYITIDVYKRQDDNYFNARSMDVYITKLRKHLKEDDSIEIINIHGKGYKPVSYTHLRKERTVLH